MHPQPWIKSRVREIGKTLAGLGRAMGGLDGSRITEIMAGIRRVRVDEVEPMAQFLNLPYEVVYGRLFGSVPTLGGDVRSLPTNGTLQPLGLIRLYAAKDAGGGIMSLSDDPAAVGPGAAASADAFDVYVTSGHMTPAYEIGDQLTIEPLQPPAPPVDVLLISGGNGLPRQATLRRLLAISETHYTAKQWNPEKTDKFDRKQWHSAFRVVAVRRR